MTQMPSRPACSAACASEPPAGAHRVRRRHGGRFAGAGRRRRWPVDATAGARVCRPDPPAPHSRRGKASWDPMGRMTICRVRGAPDGPGCRRRRQAFRVGSLRGLGSEKPSWNDGTTTASAALINWAKSSSGTRRWTTTRCGSRPSRTTRSIRSTACSSKTFPTTTNPRSPPSRAHDRMNPAAAAARFLWGRLLPRASTYRSKGKPSGLSARGPPSSDPRQPVTITFPLTAPSDVSSSAEAWDSASSQSKRVTVSSAS